MRAPPSPSSSPPVQQAQALLVAAAGREEGLGETLALLEGIARDASTKPASQKTLAARLRSLGRRLSSRAAHTALSARLEALALQASRLDLARQRLEVELREWDAWTAALAEGRDQLAAATEELQATRDGALRRRRELEARVEGAGAEEAALRDELVRREREVGGQLDELKAILKQLRAHATAAGSLQTALTRSRAQLQRLHAALAAERASLEGNVAIRAQVARRQELARDVTAAVAGEDAASLAKETLSFLTDASDLLRRHRAERERDA